MWVAAVVLGFYALRYARRAAGDWLPERAKRQRSPSALFGLDITPESLPPDVAGRSARRAEAGRVREALSLLYRGALSVLVNSGALEVAAGDTEGDCVRRVAACDDGGKARFFADLVAAWQSTAYAGRLPDKASLDALCSDWRAHFGEPSGMSRTVIGYLLGALLIAGAVWSYLNFERVSEREHVGLQGEAARNPLLALTRLIERMGGEARSAQRVEALDQVEPGATVILRTGRQGYSRAQLERLVEWVAQGGHLVVEAEDVATADTLLDALKVSRQRSPLGYREKPAEVHLPGSKPLRAQLMRPMELVDEEAERTRHVSKDGHGTHVLHFGYGRGRVTVLPSFAFMTNVAIGENDHAELAWRLLQLAPRHLAGGHRAAPRPPSSAGVARARGARTAHRDGGAAPAVGLACSRAFRTGRARAAARAPAPARPPAGERPLSMARGRSFAPALSRA